MEAAAALRCALLRGVISSLEQPLSPEQTAAITQQIVGNGLLSAIPDGVQKGIWAPVTELQGKLVEALLKLLAKSDASFRPGAAFLLGTVAVHVPVRSFLSSHADWTAALLEALRRDTEAVPRCAVLRGLGQLFKRVQQVVEVPGVRRDASGPAARTLQLATPLLSDKACRASALVAINAVLEALPAVARNHVTPLERQLAGLLAAAPNTVSGDIRTAAAYTLPLLPRCVTDDAEAWGQMARRLLISIHTGVDLLFYWGGCGSGGGAGGEGDPDGGIGALAREQLRVPEGGGPEADAQGMLGPEGFTSGGGAAGGAGRPGAAHTLQVTYSLLTCLAALLTGGSASPVPIPSHDILLLVMRLLKLDAPVLLAPGRVAPSVSSQTEVLSALPALHGLAWQLLFALVRVGRTALMPLLAPMCRLLGEHLRRIKAGGAGALSITMPSAVRMYLYDALATVLRIGGFYGGRTLAADVLGMLVTELYGLSAVHQDSAKQQSAINSHQTAAAAAGFGSGAPPVKKSKVGGGQAAATDPLAAFADLNIAAAAAAVTAPITSRSDIEAQKGALAVAETMMQVYGPALTPELRGQYDALCYHMASVTADAAEAVMDDASTSANARAADVTTLRIAATRALVASLTSPWPTRTAFYTEGIELLKRGVHGGEGLSLAKVCREGLIAVEAAIRPLGGAPSEEEDGDGGGSGAGGSGSGYAEGVTVTYGGGGSGSAAAAGMGALPKPRLWSMMDPQMDLTIMAQTAAGVVTLGVSGTAGTGAAATTVTFASPGGAQEGLVRGDDEAGPSGEAAGVSAAQRDGEDDMETAEERVGASGSRKSNGGGRGAAAAAGNVGGGFGGGKGQAKGAGAGWVSTGQGEGEPVGMEVDGGEKVGVPATASVGPNPKGGVKTATAAKGAAAAAKEAPGAVGGAVSGRVGGPPVRAAPAVAAAAVFGGGAESEDSEGSLPEIDSGGEESGSEDEA